MAAIRILTLICAAFILVEAKEHIITKRNAGSICDASHNTTRKIQCYCTLDGNQLSTIRAADCYLTAEGVTATDKNWELFNAVNKTAKLTLTNSRGITFNYIPTRVFQYTNSLKKLDVKYGTIETIPAFAFGNLSSLQEITLRDNQIKSLKVNAFAHHKALEAISLEKNNLEEINRDVFVDLPALKTLFLTSNKITTIHDRAFIHLHNLKELEINMNSLFSLNSETFSGLKKLQKLDLNTNNLEVIGDNTFLPLENLRTLHLEGNRIQMLDDKAFHGLRKLFHLDLAHNKITEISSEKIFGGLVSLTSLSLKANMIRELKPQAMAPILNNFYDVVSVLDVEDNSFPCSCKLDWFLSLMNKTESRKTKIALENFKCIPDPKLRETWTKNEENDKNSGTAFEEDGEEQAQNADYEYYDETQLNGKLFYTDVRYLLNCSGPNYEIMPRLKTEEATTAKPIATTKKPFTTTIKKEITTFHTAPTKKVAISVPITTPASVSRKEHKHSQTNKRINDIENRGTLDLSLYETTARVNEATTKNDFGSDAKPNLYTTSRLATVSASPIQNRKLNDEGMASDEAKPEVMKSQRTLHNEFEDVPPPIDSSGYKNAGRMSMLLLLCFRLLY